MTRADHTFLNFSRPEQPLDGRTGIKTIPMEKKCKKAKWLSEEALQRAVKRRGVKSKGEKERYKHLNAEFQIIARRDKKAFLSNQCKEIEENNRMGETRDLFKKIQDTKGTFHGKAPWMAAQETPLSLGFSRQEHWSGLPFPSPIDHLRRHSYLSLLFFGTLHSNGYIFPFFLCLSLLFFSQLFLLRVSQAPRRAVCGTRGSLRTMPGGGS